MKDRTSDRQCGTYTKYVVEGCRCDPCRAANRDYARARKLRPAPPYVAADDVRRHIRYLSDNGVGLKRVAAIAGVSHGAVSKIVYGDPARGQAPTKRVRPATRDRILAVTIHDTADGSKQPAGLTLDHVAELVRRGWTRAAIGRHVHGPDANALQLGDEFVTAGHARIIAGLLDLPVPERQSRWGTHAVPAVPPDADGETGDATPTDEVRFDLTPFPPGIDLDWKRQAACRRADTPTWVFFPGRGDGHALAAARAVCARCPVHQECLDFALTVGEHYGIWGGTSERERRTIRHNNRARAS